MKQLFPVFAVLLSACGQHPVPTKKEIKIDSVAAPKVEVVADTAAVQTEVAESESATYYIIQVASGHNFDSLKAISTNAVAILGSKFSMLDRLYKRGKGIIVPENSDDEMYAGSYYPRRPSDDDENYVSIEMASQFCNEKADKLEMVSIAGMYSAKSQADSMVALLKDKIPTVKTIKQEVFLGCMHL